MPEIVECCVNNLDLGTRRRLSNKEFLLREQPCLEHCGYCYRDPFVVSDGELQIGETTVEALLSSEANEDHCVDECQ
jgi:uncharacterized protein YuzB (UPF0349 family)